MTSNPGDFRLKLRPVTTATDWIETERTRLRPFEEEDTEEADRWFSDAAVMQFVSRGPDRTFEDTRRRIIGQACTCSSIAANREGRAHHASALLPR
jgi:hypothetical protein